MSEDYQCAESMMRMDIDTEMNSTHQHHGLYKPQENNYSYFFFSHEVPTIATESERRWKKNLNKRIFSYLIDITNTSSVYLC